MRRKIILIISSLVLLLLLTVITNKVFIKRTYGQSDPSLQLWLTMNDTLSDSSANLNHMSCSDCPAYTLQGVIDGAYQFSGSQLLNRADGNLNGSIPSKSSGSSESFTISAWIKLNSINDRKPIVSKQGDPERGFVFMKESDDKLTLENWPSGKTSGSIVKSATSLEINRIYHAAVVYDNQTDTAQIYLDGQLDGNPSGGFGGSPRPNSQDLIVGAYVWNSGWNWYMDGMIDDLRIYSRALDTSEIVQLFSDGITTECGDLVCEYPVETHLNCSQDCSTYCGDYVLQDPNSEGIAEACDGSDFGNFGNGVDQCKVYNASYESGDLQCNSDCSINTNMCVLGGGNGSLTFQHIVVDNNLPESGDCKSMGDVDGDGYTDILMGGGGSMYALYWYKYPGWERTLIGTGRFTTDMDVGDIDGDGDLDAVIPDMDSNNNIILFENPGDGAANWNRIEVGQHGNGGGTAHDIRIGDYDGDEKLDIVTRAGSSGGRTTVFYQNSKTSWQKIEITTAPTREGLGIGDIDLDGDLDLVMVGVWLENPGTRTGNWSKHAVTNPVSQDVTGVVGDINNDGRPDIAFIESHQAMKFAWYEAPVDPKNGTWTEHIIDTSQGSHRLNLVDVDSDRDLDFVTGRENVDVSVYINSGGSTPSFEHMQVADFAGHNAVVGDVGNDGDIDIAAAWASDARLHLWKNLLDPGSGSSLDEWSYIQIDNNRASQAFGLAMGDLTRDGYGDIASGRYFYRNPGGDMTGAWARTSFPVNVDASIIVDVDNDQYGDVIAQAFPAVYWLEATDIQGTNWNSIEIGTIPPTGHGNTEGYALADIKPGGKPEVIFGGGTSDIYYFEIPTNPSAGNWPRTQITNAANLAVGVGDVDEDGDNDVITGSRPSDVAWLENPADGTSLWSKHIIGTLENWVDHAEVADFNGDNKPDIVVTQETGSGTINNYWYEAPADPRSANWQRHLLVTQSTTNSLDSADMDNDGDIDVITGEHRGTEKVAIWENQNNGNFIEHVVDSGKESHDGTQVYDLDNDGDYDIVSITWDDYQFMHLWRNNSNKVTPTPTSIAGDANGDDQVNITDYSIWITQYFNYNPTPNANPDFNGDGAVDGVDFIIWLNNFP